MTIKTPPRLTVVPKLRRDRNSLRLFEHSAAQFSGWHVHLAANRIWRGSEEARISPKATAVLACLLAAPNQVLTREALIDTVWADREAGEEVLTQVIAELRRALGGAAGDGHLIETVRKAGYVLRAEVSPCDAQLPPRMDESARDEISKTPAVTLRVVEESETPVAALPAPIPAHASSIPGAPMPPAVPRALMLTIALACVFGAFAWWQQTRARNDAGMVVANALPTTAWSAPAPVTWEPGAEVAAAISPDGEFVVYRALDETPPTKTGVLRLRRIGDANVRELVRDDPDGRVFSPVWSADGARIVFARINGGSCSFRSIALLGGDELALAPCQLLDGGTPPFDLSPDGRYVLQALPPLSNGENPTARVIRTELVGGARLLLPYDLAEGSAALPRYSPDGKRIAFLVNLPSDIEAYVMPAEGGTLHRLVGAAARVRTLDWLADSRHLVLQRAESLSLLDLDSGVETLLGLTGAARPVAASRRDRIVYNWQPPPKSNLVDAELLRIADVAEPPSAPKANSSLFVANAFTHQPRFSRRGDQLAFVSDRSGSLQVWIARADQPNARQLTTFPAGARVADTVFTSDDSEVLIAYEDAEARGFVVRVPAAGGTAVTEFSAPEGVTAMTVSADDRALYVASEQDGAPLLRVDRASAHAEKLPIHGVIHVRDPGDGYLYFDARDHLRISRRRHSDGEIEVLPGVERSGVLADFEVTSAGVVYIGKSEAHADVVKLHVLANHQESVLAYLPEPLATQELAVSADMQRVLLVARMPAETDLYYVDRLTDAALRP